MSASIHSPDRDLSAASPRIRGEHLFWIGEIRAVGEAGFILKNENDTAVIALVFGDIHRVCACLYPIDERAHECGGPENGVDRSAVDEKLAEVSGWVQIAAASL
jgi:uncharacterized protein YfcZ (UPF0381/DUF406 family)